MNRIKSNIQVVEPHSIANRPACLIVPALEPSCELVNLIKAILPSWVGPVVIVDDGSVSAEAREAFLQVEALGCAVLRHSVNRGKGAALKTAFEWCIQHAPEGCVGVVTADADGQHLPKDILAVRDALAQQPNALVLGCRDFDGPDVPSRSRAGNKTMSIAVRALFGMRLSDTQTGLRGIPFAFMRDLLHVSGNGYAFETNMLVEAHAARMAVVEVPITTVYRDGNANSHFNPILDSLRVAGIFVCYTLSSLASSIIDLLAFALFNTAFAAFGLGGFAIAAATCSARVISGVANFLINRHVVFKRGNTGRALMRYALLWVACMCASAALVTGFSALLPMVAPVAIKIVVDVALFFANYRIQEAWVFKIDHSADDAK